MSVHVLNLVRYDNAQKAGMVANEAVRDRAVAHWKAIADFGGTPISQFGSYGEYDMVYIYEMPDEKALAANPHLTDAPGRAKYCKAIPLMTNEDLTQSLALAASTPTGYGSALEELGRKPARRSIDSLVVRR
jgi:uncharacterized protein with GYD domain